MNFLGIDRAQSNPRKEMKGPDRVTRRGRAQVVAVDGGGEAAGEEEEVGVVEEGEGEGEGETPEKGLSRIKTKLQGVITTGNGATIRRWREEGHRQRKITVQQHVVELLG